MSLDRALEALVYQIISRRCFSIFTDTKYGVEDRWSVLTLTLQKRQFKIQKVGVRVMVMVRVTLITVLYCTLHLFIGLGRP